MNLKPKRFQKKLFLNLTYNQKTSKPLQQSRVLLQKIKLRDIMYCGREKWLLLRLERKKERKRDYSFPRDHNCVNNASNLIENNKNKKKMSYNKKIGFQSFHQLLRKLIKLTYLIKRFLRAYFFRSMHLDKLIFLASTYLVSISFQ